MAPWKLDQRSGAAAWLRAAAERRALPHALLFTGGDGSAAAEFAAAAMECTAEQGRPCGVCHACRKVLSGIHPDVITVQDPEHKLLSAETVRNVRSDAYIRPNEGERKVYVFPDCALLTEADQNILLKTVEEGPPSAAFLFCAESASAVLPTLRSRCVECKLSPAETEETPPSPRAEAFLRADNAPAPITVQTNPLLTTPEALRASLEAEGVRVTPGLLPGSFQLRGTGNLTKLAAFQAGHFQVQDDAAALVTEAMDLRGGEQVLDVCAAPGGKSFRCAMAMGDKGRIVACDLYENKLRRIEAGAKRLHLTAIETAALDGRSFRAEWENAFDLVLVDAPCSGLGIIRKKPEIRYKKADDLFALPVVQTAILENASRYVKPGGQLLYSTCTILPEENGQVTDEFLAGHPDFRRESFALPVGKVPEGQITLWPQRQGTDGFYICRMRKAT